MATRMQPRQRRPAKKKPNADRIQRVTEQLGTARSLPIPDLILSYFDRVAARLWALTSAPQRAQGVAVERTVVERLVRTVEKETWLTRLERLDGGRA